MVSHLIWNHFIISHLTLQLRYKTCEDDYIVSPNGSYVMLSFTTFFHNQKQLHEAI
uniref:Uncharacterized protein n=1 Tax=Rhizophora mucronata TaxID=61149 RepID=A0A2P2N5L2_RHIMU